MSNRYERERIPFFARPHEYDRNGYCWNDGQRSCELADIAKRIEEDAEILARDVRTGDVILLGSMRIEVANVLNYSCRAGVVIVDQHGNNHVIGYDVVLKREM